MKNLPKILGITALIAVMVLFVVSCDLDDCPPHAWGEWIVEDAANLTNAGGYIGEEVRTCADCLEKETRDIPIYTVLYGKTWNNAENGSGTQTLTIDDGEIKLVHTNGSSFTYSIFTWANTAIVNGHNLTNPVAAFKIGGSAVITQATNPTDTVWHDNTTSFDFYVTSNAVTLRIRWYQDAVHPELGFSSQTFFLQVPSAE